MPQRGPAGMSPEELQRALLLLATMIKSGGPGQSPIDEYLEQERKRQEEEQKRQQDQSLNQLPDTIAQQLPPSGLRNTLGALGTANTASSLLGGPSVADAMKTVFAK